MRGTMLWFNDEKDLGYIDTDDGERVPVHGQGFASGAGPTGRCGGTVVEFVVTGTGPARVAKDVTLVPEGDQRRARRRRRGM